MEINPETLEKLNNELIDLVKKNELDKVRQVIESGANVNYSGSSGVTAIMPAIYNNNIELVRLLLEKGANIDAKNDSGITVLMVAACNGNAEIVKMISKLSKNPSAKDGKGKTAIDHAAERGHNHIIEFLKSLDNTTPIKCPRCGVENTAETQYCIKCGMTFFKKTNSNTNNKIQKKGNTVILSLVFLLVVVFLAKYYMSLNVIKKAESGGAALENLIKKAETGEVLAQNKLAETNVKSNVKTNNQIDDTAEGFLESLIKKAESGDADTQLKLVSMYYEGRGVPKDYKKAIEWLEKAAANGVVQAQSKLGSMYYNGEGVLKDLKKAKEWYEKAAAQGDVTAQKKLTEMNDNSNVKTNNKDPVNQEEINKKLFSAVDNGDIETTKTLIGQGADVNAGDIDRFLGSKLLHIASDKGYTEIAKLLIEKGADVNAGHHFNELLGNTPLHNAAEKGHVEMVKLLIEHGANVNAQAKRSGYAPLHRAAENGHVEIIKLLIEHGANLNIKAYGGYTALYTATSDDSCYEAVKILIEKGSDVNTANDEGMTPLSYAISNDCDDSQKIIKLLKEHGAKEGNVKKDNERENLIKKASSGDAKAQYELGIMYEGNGGEITPGEMRKSRKWLEKAAAQGYTSVQHDLDEKNANSNIKTNNQGDESFENMKKKLVEMNDSIIYKKKLIESKTNELNKAKYLNAFMIKKIDDNIYEIAEIESKSYSVPCVVGFGRSSYVGSKTESINTPSSEHSLLITTQTKFNSTGNFSMHVVYEKTTTVELNSGFTKDYKVYKELTDTEISNNNEVRQSINVLQNEIRNELKNIKQLNRSIFAGGNSDTLLIDLGGGVKLEMVKIPAGTFQMGSSEPNKPVNACPVHTVTITKDFYIGKYEVTRGQWKAIMNGANPSLLKASSSAIPVDDNIDNYPVNWVSWNEISTSTTSFLPAINAKNLGQGTFIFRLPTEAEWEYAARGGTQTSFYWGNDSLYTLIGNYAWYGSNSNNTMHPVGQKTPNSFGLFDMSGNILEWCNDWYGSYDSSAVTDPTGPTTGKFRVVRGGSWASHAGRCSSTFRSDDFLPSARFNFVGFRLVLSPGQ